MPQVAANLSKLYIERELLYCFDVDATDWFEVIEYSTPYVFLEDEIVASLKRSGLHQIADGALGIL